MSMKSFSKMNSDIKANKMNLISRADNVFIRFHGKRRDHDILIDKAEAMALIDSEHQEFKLLLADNDKWIIILPND